MEYPTMDKIFYFFCWDIQIKEGINILDCLTFGMFYEFHLSRIFLPLKNFYDES